MAERTGYAPGTPSWVDLTATDLDPALKFYGDLFGWEFEDAGEEAGHYNQALVRGKRVAGLGPAMGPGAADGVLDHVSVGLGRRRARGGNQGQRRPGDVRPDGRNGPREDADRLRIPTGAMFGVWQPLEHKGAQLVNENATFAWNELMTRDIEAATRFYGAVFGIDVRGPAGHAVERLPDHQGRREHRRRHLVDVRRGAGRDAGELDGLLRARRRRRGLRAGEGGWAARCCASRRTRRTGASPAVRDPQGGVFTLIKPANQRPDTTRAPLGGALGAAAVVLRRWRARRHRGASP